MTTLHEYLIRFSCIAAGAVIELSAHHERPRLPNARTVVEQRTSDQHWYCFRLFNYLYLLSQC